MPPINKPMITTKEEEMIVKFIGIVILVFSGILFLLIAVLGLFRIMDGSRVNPIWSSLRIPGEPEGIFSPEMIEGLPLVAQRYLLHAIKLGTPLVKWVEIQMKGKIKPDGGWIPFEAKQILTPGRGFVWRAKAKKGFIPIEVVDHYLEGNARVQVTLLGLIPIVNTSGPDVAKSAAGRLLGECVWLPSALLPQHGAIWEEVDDSHAKVTLGVGNIKTTLTLSIDKEGRLKEVVFSRWKDTEKDFVPFGVGVEEERTFGGYTIPSKLRAGWWYGTDRYHEFFRATIEEAVFR